MSTDVYIQGVTSCESHSWLVSTYENINIISIIFVLTGRARLELFEVTIKR